VFRTTSIVAIPAITIFFALITRTGTLPLQNLYAAQRGGATVSNATRTEDDRTLLWIAARAEYIPTNLADGLRVDPVGPSGIIAGNATSSVRYSILFEATCNSMLDYDPVVRAQAIWSRFKLAPDALVALVAPSLEVPVATQHAIAYEVREALHSSQVDVVTVAERWSSQSERKIHKAESSDMPDDSQGSFTALSEAVEIVVGKRHGQRLDKSAEAFAYAYTSRAGRRTPWRCTRLQREILHLMASGAIAPTTSAMAQALYTSEREVGESISELVNALAPRAQGEPELRDSRERLYWLMHHYGVWIRLVDRRGKSGGSTP
jgi:hypothetical protein